MNVMDGHDDKNGAQDSAGFVKGGIFSTPDLTIETENIPEATISDRANNKSRISAAFAQTDATQQNQALLEGRQNSFASTATGDIKVGGAKKKNKMPLLIIAAIAVVAVIGGAMAILMGGGGKKFVTIGDAKTKFINYATYILFDDTLDVLDGEFERNHSYELSRQVSKESLDFAFWEKATDLLENAISDYDSISNKNNTAVSLLQSYRTDYMYLKSYLTLGDISVDTLLERFLNDGEEAAKQYVSSFYGGLISDYADLGDDVVSERIVQYRSYIDALSIYSRNGCIDDGKIIESCVDSIGLNQDLEDATSAYIGAELLGDQHLHNLVQGLESRCWLIADQLDKKEDEANE